MKKNNLKIILLTLFLTLSFSVLVLAANNDNELLGSFKLQGNRSIKINSIDYVPLEEVAQVLNCKFDWEREKTSIYGHLNYSRFETDVFMIAYGHLYLPLEDYVELFDLEIKNRGNRYYVYHIRPYVPAITTSDLKLVLQTDKAKYKRDEPMAVSLLLLNDTDRSHTLRFNNSNLYDLVLKRYNREVWRLSDNRRYLQSLSIELLKSGDYRLYTELIEPGKGRYLMSRSYTLEAEIITTNGIIIRDEVEIEIY